MMPNKSPVQRGQTVALPIFGLTDAIGLEQDWDHGASI